MSDLRHAAQAALEALERPRLQHSWYQRSVTDAEAAKALRAALAQPQAEPDDLYWRLHGL
jgi:hypothetical protein